MKNFPKITLKMFDRSSVQVSYTCMTNIKQTVDGHNKATLKKDDPHKA